MKKIFKAILAIGIIGAMALGFAACGGNGGSDAIAVIVSEETGRISVAIKGEFKLRLSAEELESILTQEML